jgi:hypothetical protein
MTKLLTAIAVLPFLAGVALAGQAKPLSDAEMDQVTGNLASDRFASPVAHRHLTNSHRVRPMAGLPPHSRQLSRSKTSRTSVPRHVLSPAAAAALKILAGSSPTTP